MESWATPRMAHQTECLQLHSKLQRRRVDKHTKRFQHVISVGQVRTPTGPQLQQEEVNIAQKCSTLAGCCQGVLNS
eukprot:4416913-Amphidinium_carterae.2